MKRRSLIYFISFWFITILLQNVLFAEILPADDRPKAKYVFLFIGDGMGQAQVNLTQGYLSALEDKIGFKALTFTGFPHAGFVSTYANDQMITCSAAAGTALATGHKTNIGRISMDPEGKIPFESIAAKAKKDGFKVGIVTNVSIDHATPAAFYAHQPDRDNYFEIGMQLTKSDFDLFAGGGFIQPDNTIGEKPINLVRLAEQNGFRVINTREAFGSLAPPATGKTLILSPKPAEEASMPFSLDMDPGDLTLADFTSKAISLLYNDTGFFMMVEGGKIDWVGHDNDAAALVHEVIAFDKAVENAFSFYMKHPEETLIIVTADHETGGLALGNSETGYNSYLGLLKYQRSSIAGLNKIMSQFRVNRSGDPDANFTRLLKVLDLEMGLNSLQRGTLLSEEETVALKSLFMESIYSDPGATSKDGSSKSFIEAALRIMATKAGISWGSHSHTCVNVPVYAIGPGSENFTGYIDNTDIPRLIGEIMGVW